MRSSLFLTLLIVGQLSASTAHAASQWSAEASSISYTVVHKFHKVEGVSTKNNVMAKLTDNKLQIIAQAAVESFLSGNTSRDAHVLEVVEGHQFPTVTVRAIADGVAAPERNKDTTLTLDSEVDFHGVKTRPKMTAQLHWVDDTHISATFSLDDSLEAHKIVRPTLLFVAVDDLLKITGTLTMKRTP